MNAWIYWIGWGIITAIYAISLFSVRKIYTKRINELMAILNVKDLQIEVGRDIAENYTKDTEALRKQIAELKGERANEENET